VRQLELKGDVVYHGCLTMEKLFEIIKNTEPISIVVHNNPDPDALASAAALRFILMNKGFKNIRIYYDGLIGRAENQEVLKILKVPLFLTVNIPSPQTHQFILVDCQPFTGNVTLPDGVNPIAVIDHHRMRKTTRQVPFCDVRPQYGACSTILYEYLSSLKIDIPTRLATSLSYAISSETQSLGREGSRTDKKAYIELLSRLSFNQLSRTQYPKLSKDFVSNLSRALLNAFYYKNLIGVVMEELPYPDFAAQMADFLLRVKNMTWSICLGTFKDVLYVSIRTTNYKADASRIIKKIMPKGAASGGHEMIAGGQAKIDKSDRSKVRAAKNEVIIKMMRALNFDEVPHLLKLVRDEIFPLS
jgi:nanoRNase/pAp phosphatase (c-di-AMP/oligoRNAs hydrolase)